MKLSFAMGILALAMSLAVSGHAMEGGGTSVWGTDGKAEAAKAAEPVTDVNGVALPGYEKVDPELQKVRDEEKCVKIEKNESGRLTKSETVDCPEMKGADVATSNPQPTDTVQRTIGSDRSDNEHYYAPANPKQGKVELSWAKIESFKQAAEIAVDKNGNPLNLSENAIAGIAGNLQHESRAFQLNRWDAQGNLLTQYGAANTTGDHGTSFGIAQYHDVAGTTNMRGTDMANYVGADSLTPQELVKTTNKQYEYLFQDIKGQMNSASYKELTSSNVSTARATEIFVAKYERPALDSGEAFGLAGGTSRLNNANFLQTEMNKAPVVDGSKWVPTYVAPKNQNTGLIARALGTGSTSAGASTVNSIVSGILGQSGFSGSSGVNLTSLINSDGSVNTQGIMNAAIAVALNKLTNKSSGTSSSGGSSYEGDSTINGTAAVSTPVASTTGSIRGYELAKACGTNLPGATTESMMLVIQKCQADLLAQAGA